MGGILAGAILILTLINPTPKLHNEASFESPKNVKENKEISVKQVSKVPEISTKPKEEIYVVKSGDSLNSIADDLYGSSKYWKIIWNDNDNIENPTAIKGGMELKIRSEKPTHDEELKENLALIYEELNATPTPTPTPSIAQEQSATSVESARPSNFDEAYRQAGSRFGIPWEILYGLHFMETGLRDGAISSGFGTGAQGPMQFMPGTWASYGIDGNGDGIADINNAIDAIFGAANYLATHGGVENGLKAYGGDSEKAKAAARSRGWNQ